ncbi:MULTISPECIES: DUF3291 domain-containing protein [unclassified Frankia]
MTGYHLAQVNIARLLAPPGSSALTDFVAGLTPTNTLGDGQPGFVWRLRAEDGDTVVRTFVWEGDGDHAIIVNLTVWESVEALANFVFRSGHGAFLRRRREWFHPTQRTTNALWWVPAGHRPGTDEAEDRVRHLRAHGPTATAFTFRLTFPPPDRRISLVPGSGPENTAEQPGRAAPRNAAAGG